MNGEIQKLPEKKKTGNKYISINNHFNVSGLNALIKRQRVAHGLGEKKKKTHQHGG